MNETSKLFDIRSNRKDFDIYLSGSGIDIGAGSDALKSPTGSVRPYDAADGDAQFMANVDDEQYDFVYSSHCLEHLRNVPLALQHWTRILKPNGHLYVIIPDYTLYEKMTFPSKFNKDHVATFSLYLTRDKVKRENHFHIEDIVAILKKLNCYLIRAELEDYNYNYNLGEIDQTLKEASAQICFIARKS